MIPSRHELTPLQKIFGDYFRQLVMIAVAVLPRNLSMYIMTKIDLPIKEHKHTQIPSEVPAKCKLRCN